jgi:hypothetical protein
MTNTNSSKAAKTLVLRFILESIDHRKRCLFLQEIISLSKVNDVWRQALNVYFENPLYSSSQKAFSKN